MDPELEELTNSLDDIKEAGRVISSANVNVLRKMHTMATGLMHGFPGASKIADLCQSLLDSAGAGEPMTEAQMGEIELALEELAEASRTFSADQRKGMADKGVAMSDGSYPIPDKDALRRAIATAGLGSNSDASIKAHIKKRARALGATDMLPETWKESQQSETEIAAQERLAEAIKGSWEDVQQRVRAALQSKWGKRRSDGGLDYYIYPIATYSDNVIWKNDSDGKTWKCPWSLKDGEITLGEPVEVVPTFTEAKLTEAIRLVEAVSGSEGREWDVVLIEAGLSGNGTYYGGAVLKEAVKKFEGVSAFADHATDAEIRSRPERSIRDKVGVFKSAEYGTFKINDHMVECIKARFKVMVPWLREVLLEADRAGESQFLGFSIDAVGKTIPKTVDGKKVRWVESIQSVRSVDVVTTPAAGGRTVRLVASQAPTSERRIEDVDPEELKKLIADSLAANQTALQESVATAVATAVATTTTALQEAQKPANDELLAKLAKLEEAETARSRAARIDGKLGTVKLSDLGRTRLRESLVDTLTRRETTDEEIDAAIQESIAYEAAVAGQNQRAVGFRESVRIIASEADKYDAAIQGLFAGEDQKIGTGDSAVAVPRFRSLKESYCRWTGADPWDTDETGPLAINRALASVRYDSAVDHKKLRESLSTGSWGEIFADNLYIRMIKQYRANAVYGRWRQFVSDIEDVPDFQTRHWARIGGYGDLATVAEGATYPTLTTPTDEEVTYAISKRGGLDDITMEAIVNDRFQAVRRIPDAMARAAARTLYKFVMNLITTDNPTMDYDATALYHANHANTGTTALTLDGLDTTQKTMRDQTAYNETLEILGIRNKIKYLIVPNELEQRANRLVNPSDTYEIAVSNSADTSIDPQAFKGKGIMVEVYDQMTDATDWFAVADPSEVPTIVMGFLNGQQDPEIFVADDPRVGSALTSDKTVYKVRQIFGGDVQDHRSFYRQVVAG